MSCILSHNGRFYQSDECENSSEPHDELCLLYSYVFPVIKFCNNSDDDYEEGYRSTKDVALLHRNGYEQRLQGRELQQFTLVIVGRKRDTTFTTVD